MSVNKNKTDHDFEKCCDMLGLLIVYLIYISEHTEILKTWQRLKVTHEKQKHVPTCKKNNENSTSKGKLDKGGSCALPELNICESAHYKTTLSKQVSVFYKILRVQNLPHNQLLSQKCAAQSKLSFDLK